MINEFMIAYNYYINNNLYFLISSSMYAFTNRYNYYSLFFLLQLFNKKV